MLSIQTSAFSRWQLFRLAKFLRLLPLVIAASLSASDSFSAELLLADDAWSAGFRGWAEGFRFEIPTDGEGKWTALCESDAGVALVEVDVTFDRSVEHGSMVRITGCSRTIVLIRGMTLKPGPITTAFRGTKDIPAGTSIDIPWSGAAVRVVATATDDLISPSIILEQGSIRQALAPSQYGGDANLLWAGDLDRDGDLDLLFETEKMEWSDHQLFTSKGRKKGSLVKLSAHFAISGC